MGRRRELKKGKRVKINKYSQFSKTSEGESEKGLKRLEEGRFTRLPAPMTKGRIKLHGQIYKSNMGEGNLPSRIRHYHLGFGTLDNLFYPFERDYYF